jgi:hypothetical protein
MNLSQSVNSVNRQLRSLVKRIGMGGYPDSLSDSGPLHHEMNRKGDQIAFTNCNVFDGVHSGLKS